MRTQRTRVPYRVWKSARWSWFLFLFFSFFSFTLYPACRVDRESLILKHFASQFLSISGGIAYWVAELNTALFLQHQNEEIKILNISFPRLGSLVPQPVPFTVTRLCLSLSLCHDGPCNCYIFLDLRLVCFTFILNKRFLYCKTLTI